MKLCRFEVNAGEPRVGLLDEDAVADLSAEGVQSLTLLLEEADLMVRLSNLASRRLPRFPLTAVQLLAPVERQEVWAAGVTYLRSKTARMEESDFSANAYDRVYEADRPELFFKSMPEKVVHPGRPVGIRRDARWNVPEPELALVLNSRGEVVGQTIGNDMSSRDIEGENLLYLPQAKIYTGSCAIGPAIRVGVSEEEVRGWTIHLEVQRKREIVFAGQTAISQIKRSFVELVGFLHRSQTFPYGAVLLTGTGVVPPDGFTLAEGDEVRIALSGVGVLTNPVISV
jgi:2-dehydro-3-deoxy-D-arabinonate dehydratase